MLPLQAKELVAFTPSAFKDKENPPIYYLAVPTVADRARLLRRVMETGATYPADEDLKEALIESVREIIDPDQQEEVIAIIEDVVGATELPDDLRKQYVHIENKLRPVSPRYSSLVAARVEYNMLYPLIAAKMFLKSAENVPSFTPEFAGGMLTEDSLQQIPMGQLQEIGWKAASMTSLDKDLEKNSDSPL